MFRRQKVITSGIMRYDDNYLNFYYDLDGLIKSITRGDDNYLAWKQAYDNAVPLCRQHVVSENV